MSDYFGRLLGLSSAGAIRPRVAGLFEPTGLDDERPMIETITTPPARRSVPQPIETPPSPTRATVVPLVRQRPDDPVATQHKTQPPTPRSRPAQPSVTEITVAGQPARPPAGLTTARPAGAALSPDRAAPPANVTAITNITKLSNTSSTNNINTTVTNSTTNSTRRTQSANHLHNTTEHHDHQVLNQVNRPVEHVNEVHEANRPPLPRTQPRQRREQRGAVSEPVIRVSIGRIEVTAASTTTTGAAAPARRATKPRPATKSLASYLAERDGGRT